MIAEWQLPLTSHRRVAKAFLPSPLVVFFSRHHPFLTSFHQHTSFSSMEPPLLPPFFSFLFFCQATILSVKYPRHCVAVFVFALPPPTSWKVLCTHSLSFCLCCSPSFDLLLWFRMNPNHFPKRATTTLHLSVEASKLACFFAFACVCVCVFVCVCVCACEKKVWGGEDGHLHTRSV